MYFSKLIDLVLRKKASQLKSVFWYLFFPSDSKQQQKKIPYSFPINFPHLFFLFLGVFIYCSIIFWHIFNPPPPPLANYHWQDHPLDVTLTLNNQPLLSSQLKGFNLLDHLLPRFKCQRGGVSKINDLFDYLQCIAAGLDSQKSKKSN